MLKVGQCIRVQTKTQHDVFGVCFYEILEAGIPAPEQGRESENDGIKAIMLGGTGPSARTGLIIHDSWHKISREIASGIIEVMDKSLASKLLSSTPKTGIAPEAGIKRPNTGVVEMD
jgi:hypothetical protein